MDDLVEDLCGGAVICGSLLVLVTTWTVFQWAASRVKIHSYNKVRKQKKDDLYLVNINWAHQVSSQITAEDSKAIVGLSFEQLQKKLQEGEITASKALHAYQYSAVQQNAKSNFICEPIMEAEEMAAKLDSLSSEERRQLPLFGVPISLKENFMLEMLTAQGCVPFIRTNIPQTCMSFDSINPIYGATSNPHNSMRSCGGSSGGEASVIGGGSSVLGFGNDIGGSLRIPAAFCGIYSLKPTAGRHTFHSSRGVDFNERIVTVTDGPMGRDVDALIAAMRTLSTPVAYQFDPYVPPITFNEQELSSKRKLRIGYFLAAEPIEISETCRRAVDTAVKAMEDAGHEMVEWQPPDLIWALSVAYATNLFADGGELIVKSVEHDIVEPHIKDMVYLGYTPVWLKKLLSVTIGPMFFADYVVNYLNSSCGSGTIAKLWEDQDEIKEYRRKVVNELRKQEIDAIICPAMPVPAMRLGECKDAIGATAYMGVFNLLNFPAGIVPVTKVTAEDVRQDMETFPTKDIWHKAMKKNLEGSEGLPMTVQCATLPFHEERCLRVMKELETLVGYDVLQELNDDS